MKIPSKKTLLILGAGLAFFLVFIGHPYIVVLPKLNGILSTREFSGKYEKDGDYSSPGIYNYKPIKNANVYIATSTHYEHLIQIGDGGRSYESVSKIEYFTHTGSDGRLDIPLKIIIKFAFCTIFQNVEQSEIDVVVLVKNPHGTELVDANMEYKQSYRIFSSLDERYAKAFFGKDVSPLTWRDHARDGFLRRWKLRFKEWFWGKEVNF